MAKLELAPTCSRPEIVLYLWRGPRSLKGMIPGTLEEWYDQIATWVDHVVVQIESKTKVIWPREPAEDLYVELMKRGVKVSFLWWPKADTLLHTASQIAGYINGASVLWDLYKAANTGQRPGVMLDVEHRSLRTMKSHHVDNFSVVINSITKGDGFGITCFQLGYETRNIRDWAIWATVVEAQAFSHGNRKEPNDGWNETYGPIGFQIEAGHVLDSLMLHKTAVKSIALPLWGQDNFPGHTVRETIGRSSAAAIDSGARRIAYFRTKYLQKYPDIRLYLELLWEKPGIASS